MTSTAIESQPHDLSAYIYADALDRPDDLIHELAALSTKLAQGRIKSSTALKHHKGLTNRNQSWHTKWWKARRDELLGPACVQCGLEETLVLQHLWHPRSLQDLSRRHFEEYKKLSPAQWAKPAAITNPPHPVEARHCPECHTDRIRYRRQGGYWTCTRCAHEFTDPVIKVVPSTLPNRAALRQRQDPYQRFLADEPWQARIVLILIQESLRYLSLHDTATFCRKCAYMWDAKQHKLCPSCKTAYIPFAEATCYDCFIHQQHGPSSAGI